MIQKLSLIALILGFAVLVPSTGYSAELWKGPHFDHHGAFGASSGLGVVDGRAGFALTGQVSAVIQDRGFFPDMTNQLSIEASAGPLLGLAGTTPFQYGLHLRWDFLYNSNWTFFAVGGLGGAIMTRSFELFPRLGIGAFYRALDYLWIRADISHEWMTAGISVPF